MEKAFSQRAAADDAVSAAVKTVQERLAPRAKSAIVLGSGLGNLVRDLGDPAVISCRDIPHFPVSSVAGHKGELVYGLFQGSRLLVCSGRVHYYEGYDPAEVTFPVAVLAGLGVENLIITNASGGINNAYSVGDIVAIRDHINLVGANPLRGTPDFIDMSDAYCPELRQVAARAASKEGITLREGVYAWMAGPCYETPAEIRMLDILGADLVGMSTVPEVIRANSLGLHVLGLSLVSNMAAGITNEKLNHREVMAAGKKGGGKLKRLVAGVLGSLESGNDPL